MAKTILFDHEDSSELGSSPNESFLCALHLKMFISTKDTRD